jgi:hypothetical protein
MQIDLKIVDGVFLAVEQEHDFIVDELELPGHLFVNVVDFIHRTD